MKIRDIELTPKQISGTEDAIAIARYVSNGYEYKDGQRTDNITHIKVEAVMINNGYEKEIVKVMGTKIPLTNEIIAQNGGSVKVKFKGLRGKFYRKNTGEYALSCSADGLEVIS